MSDKHKQLREGEKCLCELAGMRKEEELHNFLIGFIMCKNMQFIYHLHTVFHLKDVNDVFASSVGGMPLQNTHPTYPTLLSPTYHTLLPPTYPFFSS